MNVSIQKLIDNKQKLIYDLIKLNNDNINISNDILDHGIILRNKIRNYLNNLFIYNIFLIFLMSKSFVFGVLNSNQHILEKIIDILLYYFEIYIFLLIFSFFIFDKNEYKNLDKEINYYIYHEGYNKIKNSFKIHLELYNELKNKI